MSDKEKCTCHHDGECDCTDYDEDAHHANAHVLKVVDEFHRLEFCENIVHFRLPLLWL